MSVKNYINNISGLQFFQLLRFGTLLLISVVFAKSNFGNDVIGLYEIFLFISSLLCTFWISGLIQSFLPLYNNNSTFKKSKGKSPEIFNLFLLVSFLSILVVLMLLTFKRSIASAFTPNSEIPFFKLILAYILFSCPAFLVEYIYLVRNEAIKIIRYGIVTFFVQFILVALPAILGYSMEYCITGLVLISVVRYGWLLVLLKKYSLFKPSLKFMKEHISFAFPLIISILLGSSAQYVDGFLVLNNLDESTFAIFKYGAKEFPLVLLMANALSTAMIPEFSDKKDLTQALSRLRKKSANLMHLLFPVSILFLLGSEWIYPRLFNENFAESAKIFNIYLLLIISRLVFPHSILIGLKKTKIVMYASMAELVINVVLSINFFVLWGIEGIAFATVIAFAIQKIIWIIYNTIVLKITAKNYIPIFELAAYSVLLLSVYSFIRFF